MIRSGKINASSSPSASICLRFLFVRQPRDVQAGRRREGDVLVELGEPLDRLLRHAVMMLEDAANPDAGGEQERLRADLAADQVGWLRNPLVGVDEDEAMAKAPVQKDRDCSERQSLIARSQIAGAGHLRHVIFLLAQKSPMPRGRRHAGEDSQVDTVRLDLPVLQRANDLVVATGEREFDLMHREDLPLSWLLVVRGTN